MITLKRVILIVISTLLLVLNTACLGSPYTESMQYTDFFYKDYVDFNSEDVRVVQSDSIDVAGIGNLKIPDDYICYYLEDALLMYNTSGTIQVFIDNTKLLTDEDIEKKYNLNPRTVEECSLGNIKKTKRYTLDNYDKQGYSCFAHIITNSDNDKQLIVIYYYSTQEKAVTNLMKNYTLDNN